MLRKLFCGLMAAGMLLATSCQQQELTPSMEGEATVTFNVGTPEIATRAFSNGTTATHFQYAVYDEDFKELKDLTVSNAEIHGSTTVSLKLKTGGTYSILFWAAAPNAPYNVDLSDATMSVDYTNAVSNAENRDAFYYYVQPFEVTGSASMNVEMRRPFAQLNIGTADYEDAKKAGYEPTESYVEVPVYSTMNFTNGNVGGQEVRTFNYAAIPSGEEFPVVGYEYMAMNYLLVPADKETIEVKFGYRDAAGDAEVRTVGAVPVQRNHRTNIYGGLITSDIDIHVSIDPIYEDPAYEADALYRAAAFGGTVTLTENTTLTSPLNVQANMVLNMNEGVTLTGSIIVPEGIDFIVNGGNISGNNKDYSAIESKGNLTLNDVTVTSIRHAVRIEGGVAEINGGYYGIEGYAGRTQHALNVSGASKVIVNGGTFVGPKGTSADSGSAVNVQSGSEVTINGGIFSKGKNKTLACGGTLKVFGGVYDQDPTAFLTEGYIVLVDGSSYTVVNGTKANDESSLKDALVNGDSDVIALSDDIDISDSAAPYVHIGREVVVNGQGNLLEVGNDANYGVFCNAGSDVTFDNIDLVSNGGGIVARDGAEVVFNDGSLKIESTQTSQRYLVYAYGTGTTVTIKDGEFSFEQYRKRGYAYVADGAVLYIEGGVFGAASNHPTNPTAPLIANGGEIIITGGTFGFDPSAYVAAGYKAVKSGSTWTVVEE